MRTAPYLRHLGARLLAREWGRLTMHEIALRRRDGTWQTQRREVYDHGDGATCLPYDPAAGTVLLVRQFRLPAHVGGEDGFLIEAPAGLLEGADAEARMRQELEEETGFRIGGLQRLFTLFMTPGSVTEQVTFFTATYSAGDRVSDGGGAAHEGEDIEVLELPLEEALAMARDGRIRDAKTVILLQHLERSALSRANRSQANPSQANPSQANILTSTRA